MDYLDTRSPDWFVWENVDSVGDVTDESNDTQSNLDIAMAELSNRFYDCQPFLLDGLDYGLPANRKR
eukprot:9772522-Lingulodinium_polyedra.AAC.1